ncbi:MAG: DinB family protein [Chloroflexota bacterium]|nr:DinB family protein [Chloroflexota bacterium]
MGTRSTQLAEQFEQAIKEFEQAIDGCSDSQWKAMCGGEGWTVAATAQHVAGQFPLEREYISAAAEGREAPAYTWDDINGKNESRANTNTAATKADVVKTLRDGGSSMAGYIRGLSDEQLDRTVKLPLAGGAAVSAEQLITGGVLIEHVTGHLQSMRAAG